MKPAETDLGGGVRLRYSYLEEEELLLLLLLLLLLVAKPVNTALEDLGGGVEKRLAECPCPPEETPE